jgi:hypothetical protein
LFGADASVTHVRAGRRRDAQKIIPFTIHATETLHEPRQAQMYHIHFPTAGAVFTSAQKVSTSSVQSVREPRKLGTFHPSPADIHTPENCLKFTGQALPLRQRRFWCPRNSRGEITICPAKWPRRSPQPRSIRVQSTGTINPRPGHVRVQSMTASASAVFPWARTVRVPGQSASTSSL